MEFSILYAIQNLHTPFLDQLILKLTDIVGSYGEIWLIVAAVMLTNRRTRRCAYTMLLSYLIVFGVGQFVLKDLVARARPCQIDETVALLVARPSSFSFPSTHSAWAFAAATSVLLHHKKAGIAVLVLAALIAKVLVDFIEKKIPDKYKE